jgi:hypothetical protein
MFFRTRSFIKIKLNKSKTKFRYNIRNN